MIKPSIKLQDLRKRIYCKGKSEAKWRFWGLYTHICKMETLEEAYKLCKRNKWCPGKDGITFEKIEELGYQEYLKSIQSELKSRSYVPESYLLKKIPKIKGKYRLLSIPTIKDRIVQSAMKLILEPIFEADFQPGSYGSIPNRSAHEAVRKVAGVIIKEHTRVIDIDLQSYYDNVRHHILLNKLGDRIADDEVMHLLKGVMKRNGKKGIAQGSPISPLLANLYLNDIDKMLEKAREVTKEGPFMRLTYARYMDDLIILVDSHWKWNWLYEGVKKRLKEELLKIQIPINTEKSKEVDLETRTSFEFLGFSYRRGMTRKGKKGVLCSPAMNKRTIFLRKLKEKMRRFKGQPVPRMIQVINPVLRGWVNYFRIGTSSKCFSYIRNWVDKKVRRHLMRQRQRKGFGWSRWSNDFLYQKLGLFNDYKIKRYIKS